jgi:hypothetical protein
MLDARKRRGPERDSAHQDEYRQRQLRVRDRPSVVPARKVSIGIWRLPMIVITTPASQIGRQVLGKLERCR